MANTSELAYDRDNFYLEFAGGCAAPTEDMASIEEIDESIGECEAMLYYNIHIGNEEEVAFWRRMLQSNKVAKRRAKKRMEMAYTH